MDNENQTPETPAQTQAQTQEPADWRQALSDSIRDAEEFKGIKSVEEFEDYDKFYFEIVIFPPKDSPLAAI